MPSHTAKMPRETSMKCESSLCSRTFPTLVSQAPTIEARAATTSRIHTRGVNRSLAANLVTDVAHCFDKLARAAELAAQSTYVNVDGARATGILVPPRALEQ